MRKFLTILLISNFILLEIAFSKDLGLPTGCPAHYVGEGQKILSLCNNIDDIICKDVKKEERRGCNESDQYVFSNKTTLSDLSSFASGCFNSAGSAVKGFFTDFIPSVLKEIIKITKGAYNGAVSLTSHSMESSSDPDGWWGKIKGIYESTASMSADIYEAATQDPIVFVTNIWDKMQNIFSSFYNSYDCLKPQVKVEKVCGFLAGWFMPPAAFAMLLVKGTKFIKETIEFRRITTIGTAEKLRLKSLMELSEKKPKLSYKKMQILYDRYRKLGYTNEDFDILYQAGALEKIKPSELKDVMTEAGKAQRSQLLNEIIPAEKNLKPKKTDKKPASRNKKNASDAHSSNADLGEGPGMPIEAEEMTHDEWKAVTEENKRRIEAKRIADEEKVKNVPLNMSDRIRLKNASEAEDVNKSHIHPLPEVTPATQEEWDEAVRRAKEKANAHTSKKTETPTAKAATVEAKQKASLSEKINSKIENEKFYNSSHADLPEVTFGSHEEWLEVIKEAKAREKAREEAEAAAKAKEFPKRPADEKIKESAKPDQTYNPFFPHIENATEATEKEWTEAVEASKKKSD